MIKGDPIDVCSIRLSRKRLKYILKEKNISLEQLAAKSHIEEYKIDRWLTALTRRQIPFSDDMREIAKVLKCNVYWLAGWDVSIDDLNADGRVYQEIKEYMRADDHLTFLSHPSDRSNYIESIYYTWKKTKGNFWLKKSTVKSIFIEQYRSALRRSQNHEA